MFNLVLGRDPRLLFGISFISTLLFVAAVVLYEDPYYFPQVPREDIGNNLELPMWSGQFSHRVILPSGFGLSPKALASHLAGTSAESWEHFQLDEYQVSNPPLSQKETFIETESKLYGVMRSEKSNISEETFQISATKSKPITANLATFFKIFREEADIYGDTYYQQLYPIFADHMTAEEIPRKWFRFAGSSVWLKSYNLHLVVSRLSYSKAGTSKKATLSMVYAQIFDTEWNEVEDVRLVIPTNNVQHPLSFELNGQRFMLFRFPCILPIPFKVSSKGKFWGAEDPRTFLVRNKNGFEEPVVVFNAFHDKTVREGWWARRKTIRSMFMSFPFQSQKGMETVTDGNESTEDWFIRTKQLKIAGEEEQKVEKNWTPLVSHSPNSDDTLAMAILLDPLRIVTCELWTEAEDCTLVSTSSRTKVGPLRGGTPLIRIPSLEKKNFEVYVGIARAHLSKCCSKSFYRPNLVVVIKQDTSWMLTHVSSSIDLGMTIVPLPGQKRPCHILNAVIPNGIESWDTELDIVTLFASVSDMTVERLTIHGILDVLKRTQSWDLETDLKLWSPVKNAMAESRLFCEAYARSSSQVFY